MGVDRDHVDVEDWHEAEEAPPTSLDLDEEADPADLYEQEVPVPLDDEEGRAAG